MHKLKWQSLILVVFFSLMACTTNSLTPTLPEMSAIVTTAAPALSSVDPYPITEPDSYIGTAYPMGQQATQSPNIEETPKAPADVQTAPDSDPMTATVYGVLHSFTNQNPLESVVIYAANIVIIEPSGEKIYSTQENSSPKSGTDSLGQFLISDIIPGEYYFMMVTPFGTYPVFDTMNNTFELGLKAGDVINFGEVFVNWP